MDVGVEFFSLSKSFDVTGARISFLVGRPDVVAAFRRLRGQIDFGMFLPVQQAAIAALTGPLDMVKDQCAVYQERRDALCGGLRSIGWNVPDRPRQHVCLGPPSPSGTPAAWTSAWTWWKRAASCAPPAPGFGPLGEG